MNWDNADAIARELASRMADASVRALVLAGMVALLTMFLRRRPAAQHALWTLVVIGMLAMPALRPLVPAAHVPVFQRPASGISSPQGPRLAEHPSAVSSASLRVSSDATKFRDRWPLYVVIVYLTGVVFFAARLALAFLLTLRLLRGARSVASELWRHYDLIAAAGVDVRIEQSDHVRVPLTFGLQRLRILLPVEWRVWPVAKGATVLAHELAHARRRDPAICLFAAANRCIFWFHPLAWWLERRLAVLAEHAADDAGLAASFDAGSYARTLLEVASAMQGHTTRLVWNAFAMNGRLVSHRIRRIMDSREGACATRLGGFARAMLWSSAGLLIWISVAVDLRSTAQVQAARPKTRDLWAVYLFDGGRPDPTTAAQATEMEQRLASDPDDEATRLRLHHYYLHHKLTDRRIASVLWLIDHHPESALHGYGTFSLFSRGPNAIGAAIFEDARSRWHTQVQLHPQDARVLGNAARALGESSISERIELLKRARDLDPVPGTESLAREYSLLLVWTAYRGAGHVPLANPVLAAQVRSELQASADVALVGLVARYMTEEAAQKSIEDRGDWDLTLLKTTVSEVVSHAQTLEPQNREWADLMEGARRLPAGAVQQPSGTQLVRIGAGVASRLLLESTVPAYPPEARAAGIQGVVQLQILIDTEGHVTGTTLLSGHPLLVPAAMEAARHFLYKPTVLEGKAVDVMTTLDIPVGPGQK